MATERVIGIDFGTSTSVIKVKTYKDGKSMDAIETADFVRFDNRNTLPTLIFKTEQNEYLIGYDAENPAVKGTRYQNFKMDLIDPNPEVRERAIALIKLFFNYMYKAYEGQKTIFPACDSETTYVSYPAKWSVELSQTMMSIAADAGFQNVHGMDEPTAAIHSALIQKGTSLKEQGLLRDGEPVNVLMVDMGAGTTDLVLYRYTPGVHEKIEFLNTWPKADSPVLFGGREIDTMLCDYVKGYLIECVIPNLNSFEQNYLHACKAWKEANVSPMLRDKGLIKYCGFADSIVNMFNIESPFPPMDRACFEKRLANYLSLFPVLVNGCIANTAGIRSESIDLVILTGGHSQWYFVNEMFSGDNQGFGTVDFPKLKKEPQRIVKLPCPQETVALGLVYKKPITEENPGMNTGTVPGPQPQFDQQPGTQHYTNAWQPYQPPGYYFPQQSYLPQPVWQPYTSQPNPKSAYPAAAQSYPAQPVYQPQPIKTDRKSNKDNKTLFVVLGSALAVIILLCAMLYVSFGGNNQALPEYSPSPSPGTTEYTVDFYLYNNFDSAITAVYIVRSDRASTGWGENILKNPVPIGWRVHVTYGSDYDYDIWVLLEDGNTWEWKNIALARYANIYLLYNEEDTPRMNWDPK